MLRYILGYSKCLVHGLVVWVSMFVVPVTSSVGYMGNVFLLPGLRAVRFRLIWSR